MRADAHTLYEPDYVACSVRAWQTSGADWVGGPMRPVGTTSFGRAVAAVTSSPLGVGPGRFHYADEAGDVETVYLGTFDRRIVDEVGGYDETDLQWAAEDQELNYRLRLAGRRIHLDPSIRSWYFPRETPAALWRQYANYGMCKASTLKKHRTLPYWRPLAPALMVARGGDVGGRGPGPPPPGGRRPAPGRVRRRRRHRRPAPVRQPRGGPAPGRGRAGPVPLGLRHRVLAGDRPGAHGTPVRRPAPGSPMSPVPSRARLGEYAVKGVHLGLRQLARAPEQQAARRLARQAGDLPAPLPAATRVTVLTPRSWAAHVQWEAMIAQALRVRGAHVEFITCGGGLEICDRANTWESPPMPCAHLHPLRRRLDRRPRVRGAAHGHAAGPPPTRPGPSSTSSRSRTCADVAYRGVPVGELVDIPVKWFLMGADVAHDPLAPLTYRRFLRAARRVVDGLADALDATRPDVVLLCNGLFFFEAICWALCRERGIDVVTYERGMIKETLVFRRNVAACLLDVSDQWAERAGAALTPAEAEELEDYLRDRELGLRTIDRFWGDARFDGPRPPGLGSPGVDVHQPHVGLRRHRPGARLRRHRRMGVRRHQRLRRPTRPRARPAHPPSRGEVAGQADP